MARHAPGRPLVHAPETTASPDAFVFLAVDPRFAFAVGKAPLHSPSYQSPFALFILPQPVCTELTKSPS